jgi:uncharacterized delta-60 repeat protein
MTDLDTTTFNTPNGYVITDFDAITTPTTSSKGKVIVLQPDGKIVMAGKFFDSTLSPSPGIEIVAVCRYLSNGTLDPGFGTLGKVTQLLGAGFPNNISIDQVTGITLQSDGKIVICGYQGFPGSIGPPVIPGTTNIFVLRLTISGTLDTTFNSGAVLPAAPGYLYTTPADITTALSPSFFASSNCSAEAIAMQKFPGIEYIVVGGAASIFLTLGPSTPLAWYALARYTLSGILDTGFAVNGIRVHNTTPTTTEQFGIDLYVDSTQILLSGVKYFNPPPFVTAKMSVVKFDGNGTVDGFFGSAGSTEITIFFTSSQDRATAIQVQTDGKIILGGTSNNNNLPYQQRCFVLARLDSTGILDPTYGSGGVVITDLSPSYNLEGRTMGIQPDDKIVLGGTWDILGTAPASFALARYDTTGALDTTFGLAGTGLILEDIDPTFNYVEEGNSLAIQPDGKILMGGVLNENQNESGPQRFILARYFGFPPFPPPIPPFPTPVVVPICFPAGTPVLTDQGIIAIEEIDPLINTIHNKPIIAITETITNDDKLVCFERNSLGYNVPNQRTIISMDHGIIYNKRMIRAKHFVGKIRGVYFKQYNGEFLYNVLMEKHYIMLVNQMRVETLNPRNMVAKLYSPDYSPQEKTAILSEINAYSSNKNNEYHKKQNDYKSYGRIVVYNRTRRNYEIHKYNPLIHKLHFQTKKNYSFLQNANNSTGNRNINNHNHTIRHNVPVKHYAPVNHNVYKIHSHTFKRLGSYGRRRR